MPEIYLLAEDLLASLEGLCSMELVILLPIDRYDTTLLSFHSLHVLYRKFLDEILY